MTVDICSVASCQRWQRCWRCKVAAPPSQSIVGELTQLIIDARLCCAYNERRRGWCRAFTLLLAIVWLRVNNHD